MYIRLNVKISLFVYYSRQRFNSHVPSDPVRYEYFLFALSFILIYPFQKSGTISRL